MSFKKHTSDWDVEIYKDSLGRNTCIQKLHITFYIRRITIPSVKHVLSWCHILGYSFSSLFFCFRRIEVLDKEENYTYFCQWRSDQLSIWFRDKLTMISRRPKPAMAVSFGLVWAQPMQQGEVLFFSNNQSDIELVRSFSGIDKVVGCFFHLHFWDDSITETAAGTHDSHQPPPWDKRFVFSFQL